MREAKFVATVFGTVTACLFGGLAVAYTTAPNVSSRDNVEIAESASDELTIAATVTSVSTTTERITTTAQTTTESVAATISESEAAEELFAPDESVSFDGITMEGVKFNAALDEPVTENNGDNNASEPVVTTIEVTAAATTTKETTTTTTTTTADNEVTVTTSAASTEPDVPVDAPNGDGSLPISESDFILLCNVVGHEAGSNWISEYDKACVVEVIMNRVNSSLYPNSIIGVLSQPYQFADYQSYSYLGTYSGYVTESVKNAVRLYFSNTEQFSHGYLSFWGDGTRNYFR